MSLKFLSTDNNLVLEVHIPFGTVMLEEEQRIKKALKEAGALANGELLKCFDTDGSVIKRSDTKLTSKSQIAKTYQTPYEETRVGRHVYQTAQGSSTFCPIEHNARIIQNAIPKLAKTLSHKYSKLSTDEVKANLSSNHGRQLSRSYIQAVSEMEGHLAQAKEEVWDYKPPLLKEPVATVSIGLDGTTIYLRDDGYRETMVGTLDLYDVEEKRLHTTYIGGAPEYGKSTFKTQMAGEIEHVKQLYPDALYIGIANGATDNWPFSERYTSIQVTEYLAETAEALFPGKKQQSDRNEWLKQQCHEFKHTNGAALEILSDIKEKMLDSKYTSKRLETIQKQSPILATRPFA